MILKNWFDRWAEYAPDRIALKEYESQKTVTYAQLNQWIKALSHLLTTKYNLKKGDRLAVVAENSILYTSLLGVAQNTGIIIAPLNYRLTTSELAYLVNTSGPRVILFDEKFSPAISPILNEDGMLTAISTELLTQEIEHLISEDQQVKFIPELVDEEDPVFIIFTSGTTGQPKGAIYTHKMMFWNSINTGLRLELTGKDRSINCAPPFHTGGWNVLLTPFLHRGAFTLLMKQFDPDLILQALEVESITIWWAVPTMLKMMKYSPNFGTANLHNIRYFIVGGEAMPLPLIETWHHKGIPIRQGYGLTEVGPNVTSLNEEDAIRKIGSIGKPNFYYDIKIITEQGSEADVDEPGELWLGGPNVSPGYWPLTDSSSEKNVSEWFKTGDVVVMDSEGFLYLVDRIKHMYISGGENVYPAEIETTIRKIPGIEEVSVIGVSDEKWGEVGCAFVVADPEHIKSADVIKFCTDHLAKFKIPKHITFLPELPKNDAGKIDKKKLKAMARVNAIN